MENLPDSWAVESEVAEERTGHCLQLKEMAVDMAGIMKVHALPGPAAVGKRVTVYPELQVARGDIVGLANWMSSLRPESAQERREQEKYDQHDLGAVGRGLCYRGLPRRQRSAAVLQSATVGPASARAPVWVPV